MIPRRYPIALATLAGLLLLLAVIAVSQSIALNARSNDLMLGSPGAVTQDQLEPLYQTWALIGLLQAVPQWAVLAAAVSGISALALVVLRARDQAGSASATASRDASAASARS